MFNRFRNSLAAKIMTGYTAIICLALINTLACMYTGWLIRQADKNNSQVYQPVLSALRDAEVFTRETYYLTRHQLQQPELEEQQNLRKLQNDNSTALKSQLQKTTQSLPVNLFHGYRPIAAAIDDLVQNEKAVIAMVNRQVSPDETNVGERAIKLFLSDVDPTYRKVLLETGQATDLIEKLVADGNQQKEYYSTLIFGLYAGNLVLVLIIGIYTSYYISSSVTRPIARLSSLITQISEGKFVSVTLEKGEDEIGKMASAIETMLDGLKVKVEFAGNIGKGNYESHFSLLGKEDTMGQALMLMRDNLKQAADEDTRRNWSAEGLAKFADILRSRTDNLSQLADNVIRNLLQYMNANQGALFLVNDEKDNDRFLEMVACYAYQKKKFLTKKIAIGEGVVGQCVLERETIYMSDIPGDYLKITSGLGEALPRHLLVVPLKINETIYGVVEIASFARIEQHQIEFVEKLGESIASTISSVKVNERTKKLLEETQMQAAQMRTQEEEMRQNMEELSATQEELVSKQVEANGFLQKFDMAAKTTTEGLWDMAIPSDVDVNSTSPVNWTERFRTMLGYKSEKDFPNVMGSWSKLLDPEEKKRILLAFTAHLQDTSGKTPYDLEYQLTLKDGSLRWFRTIGNTMRDARGKPLRVVGSMIDIQALKDVESLQRELAIIKSEAEVLLEVRTTSDN